MSIAVLGSLYSFFHPCRRSKISRQFSSFYRWPQIRLPSTTLWVQSSCAHLSVPSLCTNLIGGWSGLTGPFSAYAAFETSRVFQSPAIFCKAGRPFPSSLARRQGQFSTSPFLAPYLGYTYQRYCNSILGLALCLSAISFTCSTFSRRLQITVHRTVADHVTEVVRPSPFVRFIPVYCKVSHRRSWLCSFHLASRAFTRGSRLRKYAKDAELPRRQENSYTSYHITQRHIHIRLHR